MIDQSVRDKLAANLAKLADIAVDETDPDAWPTMETKEGRGDRLWYKKNAGATIHLIDSIIKLLEYRQGGRVQAPEDEEAEERRQIKEYEERAEQIIQAARDGRKSAH